MAEVAERTSKNAVLHDMEASPSGGFDVRSPRGLTDILRAAKDSGMNESEYAQFRDMILEYAQRGGTDVELRKKIEAKAKTFVIKTLKVEPAPAPKEQSVQVKETKAAPSFSSLTRPAPKFAVSSSASNAGPAKVEDRSEKKEAVVPANLPIGELPKKETQSVPPRPEEPAAAGVVSGQKRVVPVEAKDVTPSGQQPNIKSLDEYKARIALIKRTVNAQVGNPIVLMDSGNAAGREYMASLLGAMKAVSGNAPGTLQSSMDRLEKAFVAVSNLGDFAAKKETTPETPTAPETAPITQSSALSFVKTAVPIKEESFASQAPKAPERAPRPVASAPISQPEIKKELEPITSKRAPEEPLIPAVHKAPVVQPTPEPKAAPLTPHTEVPLRRSSAPLPPIPPATASTKTVPEKIGGTSPAIKEGGKHTTKGVGRSGYDVTIPGDTDHPVPSIVKDDLHAPEVDAGLDQLLHEWSIFRGSGLFGTGPGGRAHPLYKKIAPLPMEMIIAGTWENANKEAVLSIRDYANGWRHEQGVAYVPTESFEIYLRRVVKRILKRAAGQ
jgi:hypothetical protein